ncbi:MAG TPA: hypothetical protein PLP17_05700, partial [Oligoflexia bacterium]|nr:hypothetical protein [Oligoflexia bacterium]
MRRITSAVVLLAVWACAAAVIHSPLLPSPLAVLREAMSLFAESDSYRHIAISFFRGILGLSLALTTGVLLGLPCGRHKTMMDTIAPLASAVQGCPTIVWIT